MTGIVAALRARIDETLSPLLPAGSAVALVNFPDHGNPGDPAIWLGARRWLRRHGVRVAYQASWRSYRAGELRRAVGDGPVLLNGGGNLGDLYAGQQGTRERVLAELRDNPVIQLPQSMYFRQAANLERMQKLIAEHGHVTLLLREADSLARAQAAFAAPAALCPDLALMLDPPVVRPIPDVDVLWLGRDPGSPEHGGQLAPPAGPGLRRLDWLATLPADEQAWPLPWRSLLRADRWLGLHPGVGAAGAVGRRLQAATFTPLARRWVRRGFELLGQGRVVVTDTLHGHLLCVLTGQPHVALDNSYGKVGATWRSWTHACPTARWADSADEAVRLARELLENGTS